MLKTTSTRAGTTAETSGPGPAMPRTATEEATAME
jgi:hypothetical protein